MQRAWGLTLVASLLVAGGPLVDWPHLAIAAEWSGVRAEGNLQPTLENGSHAGQSPASGPSSYPATIAGRAEQRITYAFQLAQRGAIYAARAELISALGTSVQMLDAEEGSQAHSRAMEAGLTALREAADFVPSERSPAVSVDVAQVIAGHRTPVLKDFVPDQLRPAAALQSYCQYATEELARAGGHEPVASRALSSLGRLESAPVSGPQRSIGVAGAIALHQAALLVDPRNYQAANEMAVLQARYGRLQEARALLIHSLHVSPCPESWYNLSVVCERLGDHQATREARQQYESLQQSGQPETLAAGKPGAAVCWVDPQTFAAHNSGPEAGALRANSSRPPVATATTKTTPPKEDLLSRWLTAFKPKPTRQEDRSIPPDRQ